MNRNTIFCFTALISLSAIVSCSSSSSYNGAPTTDPTVLALPSNGTELTYRYDTFDTAGPLQLNEHVTIRSASSTFQATRVSDTIRGRYTSTIDSFGILPNGDLYLTCGCDTFPAWTHHAYGTNTYISQETIPIGSDLFECAVIRSAKMAVVEDSTGNTDTATIETKYWYAPKIRYFVKEKSSLRGTSPVIYTRTLLSTH
jgi:hypothetical protein